MKNKKLQNIPVLISLILISFFLTFCKQSETEKSVPTSIEVIAGNNQSAQVNTSLANPIEIIIKDQFNKPFSGAVVYFSISEGFISNESLTTDADGKALTHWTLGASEGEQVLTVSSFEMDETTPLAGTPLQIKATANPEPPAATSIELLSGGDQTGQQEKLLSETIQLLVKDQYGSPFEGATVSFEVTEGSVSEQNVLSNADGLVAVEWILGSTIGNQILSVKSLNADGLNDLSGSPLVLLMLHP